MNPFNKSTFLSNYMEPSEQQFQKKRSNLQRYFLNQFDQFHPIDENNKFATNLEKGIFNYAIKEATAKKILKKWTNPLFVTIYENRAKTVVENLSPHWIDEIQNNQIKSQSFASMTHQEMNFEKWKPQIEKLQLVDKCSDETNKIGSTAFKCGKCKQSNTSWYALQTRSSDEPMTIYVACLNCSNKWKC